MDPELLRFNSEFGQYAQVSLGYISVTYKQLGLLFRSNLNPWWHALSGYMHLFTDIVDLQLILGVEVAMSQDYSLSAKTEPSMSP